MIHSIIIFGGHIQALGLARQAKKEGLSVRLIIKDSWSVTRFSNSVDAVSICKNEDSISSLLESIDVHNTLLFPTSDEYVEYLSKNYDQLSSRFCLGIPNPPCVNIFANKRSTYQFCEDNQIPHPKSYYPNSINEIKLRSTTINYPIVVKPAIMYSFHKLLGKKAFLCSSSEELENQCSQIESKGYPINQLVLQEFLSGGAKCLYSFGVYAKDGKPRAWLQANRIRQNPMDFGNSTTFAVTCNIPQIEDTARKILQLTNYTGLAEVEFMYDANSNEYKFLEINTRAWKWHSISENFGFGFLSELIRDANGLESKFFPVCERKAWVERLTDWAVILKGSLKGKLNLQEAIKTYRIKKVSAVWSWRHPLPAIMYILMSPVLFLKRY